MKNWWKSQKKQFAKYFPRKRRRQSTSGFKLHGSWSDERSWQERASILIRIAALRCCAARSPSPRSGWSRSQLGSQLWFLFGAVPWLEVAQLCPGRAREAVPRSLLDSPMGVFDRCALASSVEDGEVGVRGAERRRPLVHPERGALGNVRPWRLGSGAPDFLPIGVAFWVPFDRRVDAWGGYTAFGQTIVCAGFATMRRAW